VIKEGKMVTRKSVLNDAEMCVCKDRETEYGSPEDNFTAIAKLWDTYLTSRHKDAIPLSAQDVAVMMCLLKIARIASGQTKDDNYVVLAGYAACAGEIATKVTF
jgi:hypothetical protein